MVGVVALGGAIGSPARYGVAQLVHVSPGTFPWGTFWTNVAGSFVLAVLVAVVVARYPASRYLRPFLATGFLGAFTTYSTFAVETDLLVRNGRAGIGVLYAVTTLVAGLAAAAGGLWLGRRAPGQGTTATARAG